MNESHTITLELLHNEPFSAKEPDTESSLKFNSNMNSFGRRQKGIFLTDDFVVQLAQIHRNDLSRIRSGKSDVRFTRSAMRVGGHKESFTGQDAFSRGEEFVHDGLRFARSIPKNGVHFDRSVHHH